MHLFLSSFPSKNLNPSIGDWWIIDKRVKGEKNEERVSLERAPWDLANLIVMNQRVFLQLSLSGKQNMFRFPLFDGSKFIILILKHKWNWYGCYAIWWCARLSAARRFCALCPRATILHSACCVGQIPHVYSLWHINAFSLERRTD